MTNLIYPVLLCGGSGTRLWPLSRKSHPKQFVKLLGDESLFQASALSQQAIRQRYQVDFERSEQEVIDYLRRYQIPLVTVDTDENPNELLQQVFPKR